jgi:hypothetical protein
LSQWKDNDYSVVRAIFFDKKKYTLMLTDLGSLKLFLHFIYYLGAQIAGGPSRAQLAPSESVAAMSKPEPNAIFDTAAAVFEAISAVPHRAAEPQIECKLSLAALAVAEEPQEPPIRRSYSPAWSV